jgi:uridine phosphorylase
MSIIDAFDDETEEILKPGFISPKAFGFPEVVIAAYRRDIIEMAAEIYGNTIVSTLQAGYTLPIGSLTYRDRLIAIYFQPPGGSSAAATLEELISKGGKKFVFFGACGALSSDLPVGSIVIPVEAYRDEGVSYHYMPVGDYVKIPTADRIAGIFAELNIPYTLGKTWTTDAIFRETRKNMMLRKSEGCVIVEMECASVMAVGKFRGVEIYQFLYVEDNLDTERWDPRTMDKTPRSAEERYLRIALEIATRV